MMNIHSLSHQLCRVLGLIGCVAILALLVHVGADVVLRSVTGKGVPATEEIVTRYYMVILALLPLAWVEGKEGMIKVDVATSIFPFVESPLMAMLVDALTVTAYSLLAGASFLKALDQYSSATFIMSLNFPLPVWPSYFAPPLAFSVAAIIVILRMINCWNARSRSLIHGR